MDNEDSETDVEETYLFVDFGERVQEDVFRKDVFFRVANLESENPLIQLNDQIFKGEFEDCIGTNIFFEDIKEPTPRMTFGTASTIHLKHAVTQFKTLSMKPVTLPSKLKDLPKPDYEVKIKTEMDYQTLLKKMADGSLSLEENLELVYPPKATPKPVEVEPVETKLKPNKKHGEIEKVETVESLEGKVEKKGVEESQAIDILIHKYQKLRKLARRPTRRKIEVDKVEKCPTRYQKAYEYDCIKSQVLRPSDYFEKITKDFNRDTLVGAVDIDRSVLQGVIGRSSEYYRELKEDEKLQLLSMENLPNLSIPARFWVLKTQYEHLKAVISEKSTEELMERDKFGRTLQETAEIYRKLLGVLNDLIEHSSLCNGPSGSENAEDVTRTD